MQVFVGVERDCGTISPLHAGLWTLPMAGVAAVIASTSRQVTTAPAFAATKEKAVVNASLGRGNM